jgi:hypothetical protein
VKCAFGFKINYPTVNLCGGRLSDIHSMQLCDNICRLPCFKGWQYENVIYIYLCSTVSLGGVYLFDIHLNAIVCQHRSIAMFQKMTIWRCPSSTSLFLDYCRVSLNHGLSLNNIAPSMIWMCSFIDYLSLNVIVLSSLIHHLIIFHYLLVDLNTAYFSFLGSTVLHWLLIFSMSVEKCQCHLCQGFRRLNWCSFLFNNLSYSEINSRISKIMSI